MNCTHPKKPENLTSDGKCGTCETAKMWRRMAQESDGDLRSCLNNIAELFEKGDIVSDTKNGKPLLEWEKELRAQIVKP